MSKSLEIILDMASPNAYLAYRVLPALLERTGATLTITPCLLGGIFKATDNQPPMIAFNDVKGKLDYEHLEIRRFIERHQLYEFTMNPDFPSNTLMLMRGAIVAEDEGNLPLYIDIGLAAMWEQGKKLDDPEVFVATMNEGGLNGEQILARTGEAEIKARLAENTARAVERGCFGVPSFFVGEEMFFGKERLGQIEELLMAQ